MDSDLVGLCHLTASALETQWRAMGTTTEIWAETVEDEPGLARAAAAWDDARAAIQRAAEAFRAAAEQGACDDTT